MALLFPNHCVVYVCLCYESIAIIAEDVFWTEYFHQVVDKIKGHVCSNAYETV
jgi:hypothetical protein